MTSRTDSTNPSDAMGGLLDRSAPATQADDALRDAIVAMATDARAEARFGAVATTRRRSAVRVAVIGTVAAALVGVGGVAVAASLISWGPEYENPDTEFSVTLPSGRLCEARYVAETTYPDGGPEAPGVNAELQAWLSAQDFANVDLGAGERQVAEWDAQSPDQTVVIGPEGWLMDVPQLPSTRTEDDTYAFVLSQSVKAEIVAGIEELGLGAGDDWSVIGDIKCELVVE